LLADGTETFLLVISSVVLNGVDMLVHSVILIVRVAKSLSFRYSITIPNLTELTGSLRHNRGVTCRPMVPPTLVVSVAEIE
jgi:hypothetical protein